MIKETFFVLKLNMVFIYFFVITSMSVHITQPFTYNINTACPSDIIVVKAKGYGQPNEVIDMYKEIHNFAKLHKRHKLLLNVVDLKLHYCADDVLKVTKAIEQILPCYYVARVVSPADFKSDLIDLFSHDTSLNIHSFHDENSAITWLSFV